MQSRIKLTIVVMVHPTRSCRWPGNRAIRNRSARAPDCLVWQDCVRRQVVSTQDSVLPLAIIRHSAFGTFLAPDRGYGSAEEIVPTNQW